MLRFFRLLEKAERRILTRAALLSRPTTTDPVIPRFCQQAVQRAVYPANVQLINLWSWPKIKAVRLGAGPVARAQHQRLLWLQKSPPSPSPFPSSPLKLFTGEERDCVCVPAAEKKKKASRAQE